MDVIRGIINVHAESTYRLAIRYQLNPFEWSVERDQLGPALRAEIESLMARLPPPPPAPKTLGEFLGPLGAPPPPLNIFESKDEAAAREERLKLLGQQLLSKKDKKDGED
jgi:hypothetical protein